MGDILVPCKESALPTTCLLVVFVSIDEDFLNRLFRWDLQTVNLRGSLLRTERAFCHRQAHSSNHWDRPVP